MKRSTVGFLVGGVACVAGVTGTSAAENELEAVVVTGERLEETLAQELTKYGSRLEIIGGDAIDRAGFDDVSQALQMAVPGLYVAPKNGPFDYVNVSLLGSRNSDILWLVDGVRVANRLYNTTTPLDTMPAHMIERIEVLKGGQGLFYGTQAIAGVVNVVTKGFTKETDGVVEVGADSNDGKHVNGYIRGGTGSHAVVGFASYDEADGFQAFRDQDYQPSATNRERGYDVRTAGLKYSFEPSDAFRLSGSYQYTDATLDFSYAEDVALAFNSREEQIASLKLDWELSDRLVLYVKGYWHDWVSHWTRKNNVLSGGLPTGATVFAPNAALWNFDDRGLNLLSEFHPTDNVTALFGYDFQRYGGRDDEFLIGQLTESVRAPFAQLRLDIPVLAGATFAVGARYNDPSDGEKKTVWNASGHLDINDEWFVRAQVGTAFRLPSAYELYVVDPCCEQGNPNLVSEESSNAEVGVGYADARVSIEVIGFRRTIEDIIAIDFSLPAYPDGLIVNTNGEVEVRGGELVLSARVGEQWRISFDYTYADAQLNGNGQQFQDIPKQLLKAAANWTSAGGRLGAAVTTNHVGEIYDVVGGGVGRVEHGNYSVVDLSGFAFLDADQRHRLGLRVENLFDEEYATQLRTTRRDSDNSAYGAWALGAPLTGHLTYQYRF